MSLVLAACARGAAPEEVARTMRGVQRHGHFVSPYAYEWFIRGELHHEARRLEQAIEAYRRALAGAYEDPLVLARLAEAYAAAGHADRARQTLEHALEIAPAFEGVWLARARIAERRKDFEEAIYSYERAEQVAPRSVRAPLALAGLLQRQGAPERAARVLERLLGRHPRRGLPAARARLELALLQDDAEAAAEAVTHLLRIAPARSRDIIETAQRAMARGKPFLAADLLEHVPERRPHRALRLRVWLATGRHDEAEGLLALSDPEALGGRLEMARAYLRSSQPERAESLARVEMALADEALDAWVVIGCAKLRQGHYVEAAEAFAEAAGSTRLQDAARQGVALAMQARGMDAIADALRATAPPGNPCLEDAETPGAPLLPDACIE